MTDTPSRPTEKLRDLLAKATPGRWEEIRNSHLGTAATIWRKETAGQRYALAATSDDRYFDAELIVALRNNAEALLDAVDLLAEMRREEAYVIAPGRVTALFGPGYYGWAHRIDAVLERLRG